MESEEGQSDAAPPPVHTERRSRSVGWRSQDVIRAAALVIAIYVILQLLWIAHPLVLVAFLGVLFGLAMTTTVDRLERWHIPRGVGAALVVLTFLGALYGVGAWTAPTIRAQSEELRTQLPQAIDRIDEWLEARSDGMLGSVLGASDRGAGGTAREDAGGEPRLAERSRDEQEQARERAAAREREDESQPPARSARESGSRLRERLSAQLAGAQRYLFPFITSTVTALGGVILVLMIAIYVAADPEMYRRGLMHLFPHKGRERAGEVLSSMASMLRRWLRTQLIAMAVIGVVTSGALIALDIPGAIPLGIIAGLLEFIPTIGPIIAAFPAVAMGFIHSPERALIVALVYIVIQQLESHVLTPLLMQEGVDLPPAMTIIAQAIMAIVFGFLGLLVAVPILVTVMVGVKMLYVQDVVGDEVTVADDGED